jgi:hypothetical protein
MKLNVFLTLNGNLSFGNVDRKLLATRTEGILSSANRAWVFKTQDSYRFGTARSIRTENDFVLVNYIYHQPFKRIYPVMMLSYENNLLKKIRNRLGAGLGVTFVSVKTKSMLLKFSATAFLDRTIFNPQNSEGRSSDPYVIDTVRPTLRIFEFHQVKEKLTFFYELIDQLSISKRGNHRLTGAAGFNYVYSNNFDLVSRLNYTHEDVVIEGVKANDWYLTFGINLHYKQKN